MRDCEKRRYERGLCIRCPNHRNPNERRAVCSACAEKYAIRPGKAYSDQPSSLQRAVIMYLPVSQGGKGLPFTTAAMKAGVSEEKLRAALQEHKAKTRTHYTPYLHSAGSVFRTKALS